jgi:4-amino-4-deoxy-L-arabinose transferase-like glycosyltransferase
MPITGAEVNSNTIADRRTFSGHTFHVAVVAVLSGLLLFFNLHEGGLAGYDDALYAHEGREMLSSGDWWNIRYNGGLNFEYPPMFIWMEAASMSLWGVTDFAAKFPSALAGIMTILAVFFLGRKLQGNYFFPICAAWILMLSQYFLKYSMHAMTDVPYAFFFTAAVLLYVMGIEKPGWLLLCGVSIAGAVLTRSVLGYIPCAVIVIHSLAMHRFRLLRSPPFISAILLAFLLPSVWYLSQYFAHGEPFLERHFAFISSKAASGEPFDVYEFLWGLTKYPRLLLKLYWPWLPFMLIGLWSATKCAVRRKKWPAVLLATWVFTVIVLLSAADAKMLRYIMPVFPAFALLSAIPISRWIMRIRHSPYVPAGYFILCILVVGIAVFDRPYPRADEFRRIGSAVEAQTRRNERMLLYTFGELRHDFRNQFLWYSNRYCDHLHDPEALRRELGGGQSRFFVMDRSSYERFVVTQGIKVANLQNTDHWVFFRRI